MVNVYPPKTQSSPLVEMECLQMVILVDDRWTTYL